MPISMQHFASIASRYGVDPDNATAVEDFFEKTLPGMETEVQETLLDELLYNEVGVAQVVQVAQVASLSARTPVPVGASRNFLSSDVAIKGSIKFQNDLTIDGKVEGEIASPGSLTVGENAEIRGEIKTKSVIVHGKIFGNITVDERCELKGRSVLQGDLKAARLVIEEGATFAGKSEVTPNRIPMKQPQVVRAPDQKQQARGSQ